jgi:alpha-tubulin suppressor-like RCC1 family protein
MSHLLKRLFYTLPLVFIGCLGSMPGHAANLSGVVAISAGWGHTCALTTAGGVKCWGKNDHGQLGDNTVTERKTPVDVTGLSSSVAAISASGEYTCALTTAGGVKCWGMGGNLIPSDMSGLTSGVVSIDSSSLSGNTCVLTTIGGVKCFIDSDTSSSRSTYLLGSPSSGVTAISAGNFHACAITTTGGVTCWGWNISGQLGDNTTTDRDMPVKALSNVV